MSNKFKRRKYMITKNSLMNMDCHNISPKQNKVFSSSHILSNGVIIYTIFFYDKGNAQQLSFECAEG